MGIKTAKQINIGNTSNINYKIPHSRGQGPLINYDYTELLASQTRISRGNKDIGDRAASGIDRETVNPIIVNGQVVTSARYPPTGDDNSFPFPPDGSFVWQFDPPIIAPVQIYRRNEDTGFLGWELQDGVRIIDSINQYSMGYQYYEVDLIGEVDYKTSMNGNYSAGQVEVTMTTSSISSPYGCRLGLSSYCNSGYSSLQAWIMDQTALEAYADDNLSDAPTLVTALKSLNYGAARLSWNDLFWLTVSNNGYYNSLFSFGRARIEAVPFGLTIEDLDVYLSQFSASGYTPYGGLSGAYDFFLPFGSADEYTAAECALTRWNNSDINWVGW